MKNPLQKKIVSDSLPRSFSFGSCDIISGIRFGNHVSAPDGLISTGFRGDFIRFSRIPGETEKFSPRFWCAPDSVMVGFVFVGAWGDDRNGPL